MPSSDKPAGFFNTFSILDPNGVLEGSPRAQKRNRRVFVCIPCHRRKLKCDKGQPCSRCSQSGAVEECVYQPLPNSAAAKQQSRSPEPAKEPSLPKVPSPSAQDRTRSSFRLSDGKARVSGSTHWAKIACEFEEACPYIFGTDSQWDTRYRQIKGLRYLFSSFPSVNFPFSNTCPIPPSQRDIANQLPPWHVVEALVTCYFQSCEVTHRLFHPLQLWDELNSFWSNRHQALDDGWFAQLLMVLAIGCHNAPDYLFNGTGRSRTQWIDVFLEGAQICFGRSPYMASPSLTTIRTLCLTVLAKMLEIVKGSTSSQIASLMGFVTRLAMSMQLHRTTKLFPAMPAFEAELRRRVWVTVQLLEVDVAMRAGTPFLCTEHDAEAPLNINESDFRRSDHGAWEVDSLSATPHVYTDGMFQVKLAQFLPLVAEIINTVNSPTQPLVDFDIVLGWDRKLRQKLRDVETSLSIRSHSRADRHRRAAVQRQLFEVLVHRAKLAIHLAFTRAPYDDRFAISYRTVRESSLALLAIQELLAGSSSADSISNSSRSSSPSSNSSDDPAGFTNWLIDLCRDDFDAAMLCMILAMRKQDFGGRHGDDVPARDMAWLVLQRGLMLFRQRACRSLHHFKQFVGLSIMTAALQCVGDAGAMLSSMMQVANEAEQVVLAGTQDVIWMGNSSGLVVQESLGSNISILDMDPELVNVHLQ